MIERDEYEVRIKGQAEARDLEQQYIAIAKRSGALRSELRQLEEAYARGAVQTARYREEKQRLDRAMAQQEKALEGVSSRAAKLGQDTDKAAGSTKNLGQMAMTASYAFQDFTSVQGGFIQKLGAIQNNLPNLIMQLGGPAGLAGAISIVSIGLGIAIPKIIDFLASLSGDQIKRFDQSVAGLGKQLEFLSSRPHKVSIDYAEIDETRKKIDEAKRALDAFEAAKKNRNETQQVMARTASENVAENAGQSDEESGAEVIRRGMRAVMEGRGVLTKGAEGLLNQQEALTNLVAKQEAALKAAQADPDTGGFALKAHEAALQKSRDELAATRKKIDDYKDEQVKKLVGRYLNGIDSARQQLQDFIEQDLKQFQAATGLDNLTLAKFRGGLMEGSAQRVRERKDEQGDQAREQRMRDLDKELVNQKVIEPNLKFGSPDLEGRGREAARKAFADNLDPKAMFEAVKAGIKEGLAAEARAKNLPADGKPIDAAAGQMADKVIAAVTRENAQRNERARVEQEAELARRAAERFVGAGGDPAAGRARGGRAAQGGARPGGRAVLVGGGGFPGGVGAADFGGVGAAAGDFPGDVGADGAADGADFVRRDLAGAGPGGPRKLSSVAARIERTRAIRARKAAELKARKERKKVATARKKAEIAANLEKRRPRAWMEHQAHPGPPPKNPVEAGPQAAAQGQQQGQGGAANPMQAFAQREQQLLQVIARQNAMLEGLAEMSTHANAALAMMNRQQDAMQRRFQTQSYPFIPLTY